MGKKMGMEKNTKKIQVSNKNGLKNGYGKEYNSKRLIYEGNYLNDKRYGHGKIYDKDGIIVFEGEFINGINIENIGIKKKKGKGTIIILLFVKYIKEITQMD